MMIKVAKPILLASHEERRIGPSQRDRQGGISVSTKTPNISVSMSVGIIFGEFNDRAASLLSSTRW